MPGNPHYASAEFYKNRWNFTNHAQKSSQEPMYTSDRGARNTVVWQGHQAMYNPRTMVGPARETSNPPRLRRPLAFTGTFHFYVFTFHFYVFTRPESGDAPRKPRFRTRGTFRGPPRPYLAGFTTVIENTGHWGRNVYPGVGKVRAGLASAINQVSYNDAYGGAAQQSHTTF